MESFAEREQNYVENGQDEANCLPFGLSVRRGAGPRRVTDHSLLAKTQELGVITPHAIFKALEF